jgi:hypothetical protein
MVYKGLARCRIPVNSAEVNPAEWIVNRVVYEAMREAECVMHPTRSLVPQLQRKSEAGSC